MTYLIQVAFAYLVAWGLCLLVRNARARLRMWGGFLALATAYWISLLLPHGPRVTSNIPVASIVPAEALTPGWSWAVPQGIAAQVRMVWPWILPAYVAIVVILLAQSAVKSWSLKRFLASGSDAPTDVNAVFEELCTEMRVGKCRLILMPGLRSPATANWWRPYVLLPAELAVELDGHQLVDVLRHELVHIRRRDYLWDRLAAIACRIVFFHPVMWLAHRRLRWEREFACDEAVVRHNQDHRVEYAECLTRLARWWFLANKNSPDAIGFASSASLLGTRVRALLVDPVPYSTSQRGARAVAMVSMLAVAMMSLPAMRLSLYSLLPDSRGTAAAVPGRVKVERKPNRERRADAVIDHSASVAPHPGTADNQSADLPIPSSLAVIEKPTLPVFAGTEQHSAPDDVSGASSDGVAAASTAGTMGGSIGSGAPPSTVKKPTWQDTAVDAITTGVAIIRSRTSVPAGGSGGTPTSTGGGSSGGGSSGGGGGGEGPDHFTGPN